MPLRLYNTLSREKSDFKPAGSEVKLYVCGVTVYDYSHLGHAMSSIIFEVLHRYLEYRGFKVRRVQNFTDVDDKIIRKAVQEGTSADAVSDKYVQSFFDDMDALKIRRADLYPRVTREIPQIIDIIRQIEARGGAYDLNGSVYFRVLADADYGKLSHRSLDEMLQGTRFEAEQGKEHPADFALWKASKPGEPAWDSPWGSGRPGWHIECSAMVLHHLGASIDIHGGGNDLIFPHHENEMAQSETATGAEPFTRWWLHNGMLRLEGEKMSKSLGNIVQVREAIKRHSPEAVRLWVLSGQYRSPLLYDPESIEAQERALRRLRGAVEFQSPAGESAVDGAPYKQRFIDAMDDDLNTPQGIAAVFDLASAIYKGRDSGANVQAAQGTLREITGALGLSLDTRRVAIGAISDAEVDGMVRQRTDFRTQKRFADADGVRKQLEEAGIVIKDGPTGTTWTRL
ncbi:MAG: cysteine--tRNA ligase [Dehalococcoidia bacterium]|nr:cysteine--tRNA ligase [Dehalococcoidia bacterium]MSQ34832.1 cysteine--tRNA ligase [Dehalococcoidia bacterium]